LSIVFKDKITLSLSLPSRERRKKEDTYLVDALTRSMHSKNDKKMRFFAML